MTKIMLSFDDGRQDNYRTAEDVLVPLKIPATFNITTGYIEGTAKPDMRPCDNPPLTKEEVIKLSQNPLFEIAGHGHDHGNEINNLVQGVTELRKWCDTDAQNMGMASPHSQLDIRSAQKRKDVFIRDKIVYIRLGDRILTKRNLKIGMRKLNRMLHFPRLFCWIYKESMLDSSDNFFYYSVPVLKCNTIKEIQSYINKVIIADKDCIFMFHSILKSSEEGYNSLWAWDYDRFCVFCNILDTYRRQGKIQICRTIDLRRDIKFI